MSERNEFLPSTIRDLQKRAAFLCSNPDCRCLTIAPDNFSEDGWIYLGHAAHITAAAEKGPRFDPSISSEQRGYISNAIYLCPSCASLIDKNNGVEYSSELLRRWKSDHENWVRDNLNKKPVTVTEVSGTHEANGMGDVAGLRITKPTIIKPGTIARGSGSGKVSGTSIE